MERSRTERGIVITELMTAAGIIAILIGLLLPSLQTLREQTNAARATTDVKKLCAMGLEQQRAGQPVTLGSMWTAAGFSTANGFATNGYAVRVATGDVNGDGQVELILNADPVAGVTGSVSLNAPVLQGCPVTVNGMAGADTLRQQMLDQVKASGATALHRLSEMGLSQKDYSTIQGTFSFQSIQSEANRPGALPVVSSFVAEAYRHLRLGTNGEQWSTLPGTTVSVIDVSGYFAPAWLVSATRVPAAVSPNSGALLAEAEAAHAAGVRGDSFAEQAALSSFLNRAKGQAHEGIEPLVTLAQLLTGTNPGTAR